MTKTLVLLLALVAAVTGCISPQQHESLRQDYEQQRRLAEQLQQENDRLQGELRSCQDHVQSLLALGENRLDQLFLVQRIALSRHTGGVDTDDQFGHDAVRVYVEPIDQQGSIIKAAGSVTIRLFDLSAEDELLLGECSFDVEQTGQAWRSGFLSYHYALDCSFQRPPTQQDVTVRVQFVEYLTGRTFSAQRVVQVALPPRE